jgi:hypothetical protein
LTNFKKFYILNAEGYKDPPPPSLKYMEIAGAKCPGFFIIKK